MRQNLKDNDVCDDCFARQSFLLYTRRPCLRPCPAKRCTGILRERGRVSVMREVETQPRAEPDELTLLAQPAVRQQVGGPCTLGRGVCDAPVQSSLRRLVTRRNCSLCSLCRMRSLPFILRFLAVSVLPT